LETWDVRSLDVEPHFPKILRSDAEGRAIVINLPAGEQLQWHQTHERSWLVVADGEVELESSSDGIVRGGAGLLAHAAPNERREIRAVSDARLVMVLVPWPGEGHPSQQASSRASK
jgi:quercetin dioxygenase-like cupin family protein